MAIFSRLTHLVAFRHYLTPPSLPLPSPAGRSFVSYLSICLMGWHNSLQRSMSLAAGQDRIASRLGWNLSFAISYLHFALFFYSFLGLFCFISSLATHFFLSSFS